MPQAVSSALQRAVSGSGWRVAVRPFSQDRLMVTMSASRNDFIRGDLPWSEKSLGLRALGVLFVASCIAMVAAILVLGGIETTALNQPKEPNGIYQHPFQVKGTVRYLTDKQVRIHEVVSPALAVFAVVCAV